MFPLQMHIVHIKEQYDNLSQAVMDRTGVAVLGFVFQVNLLFLWRWMEEFHLRDFSQAHEFPSEAKRKQLTIIMLKEEKHCPRINSWGTTQKEMGVTLWSKQLNSCALLYWFSYYIKGYLNDILDKHQKEQTAVKGLGPQTKSLNTFDLFQGTLAMWP